MICDLKNLTIDVRVTLVRGFGWGSVTAMGVSTEKKGLPAWGVLRGGSGRFCSNGRRTRQDFMETRQIWGADSPGKCFGMYGIQAGFHLLRKKRHDPGGRRGPRRLPETTPNTPVRAARSRFFGRTAQWKKTITDWRRAK